MTFTEVQLYQIVFILIASIIGVVLTVYDKAAAKAKKRRVPEAVLVAFGAIGGALLMYIVMQLIHHKTRKPKFSVGFPVIIVLQAAALVALNLFIIK